MNAATSSSRCQERPKRVRGERQRKQDVQFRQRKKQERQQLLETAQQLEPQLAKLRQTDFSSTSSPLHKKRKSFSPCVAWQSKAETMKQQRFEAELLNMTLRRALAKEQQTAKSLQSTMNKRPFIPESVMYDMRQNLAQTETQSQIHQHSQCCNPTTLHINPVAVRCEIEATLQRMLLQADTVLNATATDNSISFDSRIRLDPVLGLTTDVTSTTPMNCSLDRAVKLLGPKFNAQRVDLVGPRCVPRPRHGGGERQFTVELGAPYQTVLLDGFGSTRRSDDDNRRLIVWAAVSFDRCGALCFRECTWLAVHRSQENPASASVIRSRYSLTTEKAVGCTMIDGELIEKVRDRALRAMGKQIKERYLAMQRGILLQTGRGDLIAFVGS